MASGMKSDDEDMLLAGDEPPVQQTFFPPPQTQQPYPGMGSSVPAYPPPHHPYPPGQHVPLGAMAAQHHNTTTVVVQQPAAPMIIAPRIWSSSLCDCCDDMGSCMLATFCPMILSCQIAEEMGESMCVPCCVGNWLTVLRTKLRAEQKIDGTVMDDNCTTCWCGLCVLCQMKRELKFIRRSYAGAQPAF